MTALQPRKSSIATVSIVGTLPMPSAAFLRSLLLVLIVCTCVPSVAQSQAPWQTVSPPKSQTTKTPIAGPSEDSTSAQKLAQARAELERLTGRNARANIPPNIAESDV